MANKPQIVREYEELNKESTNFNSDEIKELKEFALKNTHDNQGNYRPVLEWRNGRLKAQNYVGIIQTRNGKVLEILPKVDLVADDNERPKKFFCKCSALGAALIMHNLMRAAFAPCKDSTCWKFLCVCFWKIWCG